MFQEIFLQRRNNVHQNNLRNNQQKNNVPGNVTRNNVPRNNQRSTFTRNNGEEYFYNKKSLTGYCVVPVGKGIYSIITNVSFVIVSRKTNAEKIYSLYVMYERTK